jgi:predicted glutamine amidotransferase
MCRIAAYSGPAIPLENIIVRPAHSLRDQSQHASEPLDGRADRWTMVPANQLFVLPAQPAANAA